MRYSTQVRSISFLKANAAKILALGNHQVETFLQ